MTVSSVTATTPTATISANSTAAQAATINYNEFLQLLVTELQNQDPTNPMDPTQQVSQLASFSSVEQQVQTNSTLTSLLNNSYISQAEAAIGKTATSADGSVSGTISSVSISSSGATATLTDGNTLSLGTGVTIS
ncbi:flagellar hook assembly protein FlgD [Rhodoblastus acidophilus]|uniref:Basal-body rod modification protein FlgD n=1 Tax=Candidatus Rhodoblastus alkanivorans TaxID=2954117 RepID=A0ABS9Z423_9HYPH|nr:flagellar hook assembly protein FlgD [Candidatus Rhodoblastus alkanivorans]MCI4678796.1 flagellar hook assembly protein FlgD [Candidatus Rhodoblastus alkanivorans]MCI4682185.1 flagellar hook assembly protein FlgD [Candidatus Rhodoblastus alkanivorans]MDI4639487.1 flagellar hook assembly protein FlgD [Rhodoblastus acidophilus]